MLLGIALAARAIPAQESDILTVRALIEGSCSVTGGVLDFGLYQGAARPETAEIAYTCDAASAVTIALDQGQHARGNRFRRMASAQGDLLDYFLYQDPARSIEWGDSPAANFRPLVIPEAATSGSATVYGLIPDGQDLIPGAYEDRVLITISVNP